MTNFEIAEVLIKQVNEGNLDRAILPYFINSLRYGGPVPDPKYWINGIAKNIPSYIVPETCKKQLKDIADRWDTIINEATKGDYGPWPDEMMKPLLEDLEREQPKNPDERMKILERHGFSMESSGRLYRNISNT